MYTWNNACSFFIDKIKHKCHINGKYTIKQWTKINNKTIQNIQDHVNVCKCLWKSPPPPSPPYPTLPPVKPEKSSIAYVTDARYCMRGDHTLSKYESLSPRVYLILSRCNVLVRSLSHILVVGGSFFFQCIRSNLLAIMRP